MSRLAAALALACALPSLHAMAAAQERDAAAESLRREVTSLRAERTLAFGKGFYLRLDAARRRLALMLQGVVLDDYEASRLEWGVPQVLFVERRLPADWELAAFANGRLDPERARDRLEVVAATPSAPGGGAPAPSPTPSAPAVPKSAEETVSVPSRYRIVFDDGVSLEVSTQGAGGRNRSILRRAIDAARLRLQDLGAALGVGTKERVRLRVELTAEGAASLYRSLPPEVSLIVVGLPRR
ncbi:MAG: hypothetical protein AB7Q30_19985 [Vicinamibacteria bacterium]